MRGQVFFRGSAKEDWKFLGFLAEKYDREGGGGDQFRSRLAHTPHTFAHYRMTAAWEARRMDEKFHPWRTK